MEQSASLKRKVRPLCDKAHSYWREILSCGDVAIDATCGNGHDTLFLGEHASVIAYDIQTKAIEETRRCTAHLPHVTLKLASHVEFDEQDVKLIVYNLGYLPGSDKTIMTRLDTTLKSLESAKRALSPDGMLSIMCYPGHAEGACEAAAVEQWARNQDCSLIIERSPGPFLLVLSQFAS